LSLFLRNLRSTSLFLGFGAMIQLPSFSPPFPSLPPSAASGSFFAMSNLLHYGPFIKDVFMITPSLLPIGLFFSALVLCIIGCKFGTGKASSPRRTLNSRPRLLGISHVNHVQETHSRDFLLHPNVAKAFVTFPILFASKYKIARIASFKNIFFFSVL